MVKRVKCSHLYKAMNRLKSQLNLLHVLKGAKPQAQSALVASAYDDLIKAIIMSYKNVERES